MDKIDALLAQMDADIEEVKRETYSKVGFRAASDIDFIQGILTEPIANVCAMYDLMVKKYGADGKEMVDRVLRIMTEYGFEILKEGQNDERTGIGHSEADSL